MITVALLIAAALWFDSPLLGGIGGGLGMHLLIAFLRDGDKPWEYLP